MTKDDIIRMARQICDVSEDGNGRLEYEMDSYGLVAFANLIAAAEREACAKAGREAAESTFYDVAGAVEAAIRARGVE